MNGIGIMELLEWFGIVFSKERAQTQILKFTHNLNEKNDTEWKLDESTLIFKDKRFLVECTIKQNL